MTDIVDHANRQAQRELESVLSQAYTAPANSIYDCVECDKPIGIQRKAAVPWATRCVDCQSHYERKR
ncbi:TraR/DksA C4-type zinc finger protein [Psychrobacter celer]|uniref:TraR/DksA C4-type zinc finger protein n=1 Tax=Psychrobacter celer TaxID=306572 RepID=UPI003FD5DC53